MKYIKTFEKQHLQWYDAEFPKWGSEISHEIGEYIKLKDMSFYDNGEFIYIPDKGKIINLKDRGLLLVVLMENGQILEFTYINFERLLTTKEIEELELKLDALKYNL